MRMLLPILVGILVAKWVADAATHSLYHGLLEARAGHWLYGSGIFLVCVSCLVAHTGHLRTRKGPFACTR